MTPSPYQLLFFLARHFLAGAAGAILLCLGILYFDVARIYSLSQSVPDGELYILMLFLSLMSFFGAVAAGIGVMSLGTFSDNAPYRDERHHHDD